MPLTVEQTLIVYLTEIDVLYADPNGKSHL